MAQSLNFNGNIYNRKLVVRKLFVCVKLLILARHVNDPKLFVFPRNKPFNQTFEVRWPI
jgi:hypothetical protein